MLNYLLLSLVLPMGEIGTTDTQQIPVYQKYFEDNGYIFHDKLGWVKIDIVFYAKLGAAGKLIFYETPVYRYPSREWILYINKKPYPHK